MGQDHIGKILFQLSSTSWSYVSVKHAALARVFFPGSFSLFFIITECFVIFLQTEYQLKDLDFGILSINANVIMILVEHGLFQVWLGLCN